ncbi:MAG: TetR/AcrR family transcriptional regulator [Rhodocyclaceae bacterium]|jgi:TetR/AcrR family transcriptional regulator of autoinduction and epiphytic fitness|nr:TetR/AcrR family transcriptional regulator [Rhodocyclaceae bacterium]MCE2980517.1 TetR/AcrR family transcriptional regulator [Betaproteobacteria bacterium]MCA3076056.1 TetR/AcrR family transcriptional regulator [Rhodocyclaceae bacterium]MCA3089105.1 TetR/AcrR family transcriptional regulator [Rhodocyclaceae bacterium]MCA3099809.1 TetR/AcrR family transcriptional regulator [Rhodocyclaceae bacterium]
MRLSFQKQQFAAREDAILDAVNVLLAKKGFDLMTMDDVAAEVGIAKGSLYKHFASKESLAAAALCRMTRDTIDVLAAMPPELAPIDKLKATLRWALERRLKGAVPHLPSTSVALQRSLMLNLSYVRLIMKLNAELKLLVIAAQNEGALDRTLPNEVIVYTIYARSCDPTLEYLRKSGRYDDVQTVDFLVRTCFEGLNG